MRDFSIELKLSFLGDATVESLTKQMLELYKYEVKEITIKEIK